MIPEFNDDKKAKTPLIVRWVRRMEKLGLPVSERSYEKALMADSTFVRGERAPQLTDKSFGFFKRNKSGQKPVPVNVDNSPPSHPYVVWENDKNSPSKYIAGIDPISDTNSRAVVIPREVIEKWLKNDKNYRFKFTGGDVVDAMALALYAQQVTLPEQRPAPRWIRLLNWFRKIFNTK